MNERPIEEQIREVRDRLERIRRDLAAPLERDIDDQSIQLENREVLMELERVESERLMALLARLTTAYLKGQVAAGAQALQIFDSWVGCLAPADYREYVLPHMRAIFAGLPSGVPAIHFGTGTSGLLELMREAGGDVIGVDWRVDLGDAWRRVGYDVAVQGNLDPVSLCGSRSGIRRRVETILAAAITLLRRIPHALGCEIIESGIVLTGGGALLTGLRERLAAATSIHVTSPGNPLDTVVIGLQRMTSPGESSACPPLPCRFHLHL